VKTHIYSKANQPITLELVTNENLSEVEQLFAQLHQHNASLDPTFTLCSSWKDHFVDHLCEPQLCHRSQLLAKLRERYVGLIMLKEHVDAHSLFEYRRWVEIEGLYVQPEARGYGVGQALLDAAHNWAQTHGHQTLQLYVTQSNYAAQEFYRKHGFHPTQQIWKKSTKI
jgi:ribosomal protein S18 acetylase RimI-like enzyme